jgi:hypothetical protein
MEHGPNPSDLRPLGFTPPVGKGLPMTPSKLVARAVCRALLAVAIGTSATAARDGWGTAKNGKGVAPD